MHACIHTDRQKTNTAHTYQEETRLLAQLGNVVAVIV
jgi:hypothetical protein